MYHSNTISAYLSKLPRVEINRIWYRLVSNKFDNTLSDVNSFTERSHNCGQLNKNDVGRHVNLYGWVQYTRFDNKIIQIRDSYGCTQCIVNKDLLTKAFRQTTINNESVIHVSGQVCARPDKQINPNELTGEIEVLAKRVEIVNHASKDIPILTRSNEEHSLTNRLKNRYLDLRSQQMQEALRIRSILCQIFRQKLCDLGFVECETPTLFKRTPGGANEFVVPTQVAKKYYALTQSPQQLKQLLMIGGLDRYFQICRCYRDEVGRSDRQPEFTQLDIELSFTNKSLVMELIDKLVLNLLCELNRRTSLAFDIESIFIDNKSLPRMTYRKAIERYGSDKPDTRFGWLIEASQDGGLEIKIPLKIDEITLQKILKKIGVDLQVDTSAFEYSLLAERDHLTIIRTPNESDAARKILGLIRLKMAKELCQNGENIYDAPFSFVWVQDFPLFEEDKINGTIVSNHHPFTAPNHGLLHLLKTDPMKVTGQHYDLILNGQEIAGGSIRIHDADLQSTIFRDVLRLTDDTFNYFIEALRSGCPPHGGIAFGLDRLVAILLGRNTIREVIAFPKSNVGHDLMSDTPHELDDRTRALYHLK